MFLNKTVFILGAGASWHYGYPTGEELVRKVLDKARAAAKYVYGQWSSDIETESVPAPKYVLRNYQSSSQSGGLTQFRKEWDCCLQECNDIINRLLAVDPLVIDYFLGHNPHLGDIGKFLIAWVLLECEAVYREDRLNDNRRGNFLKQGGEVPNYKNDNWYRFIIHKLVSGCEDADSLFKNQVTFVTFNYDVSLELELFKRIIGARVLR